MTNLEIRLLGGLHVGYGDTAPHFVSSKASALLAYLAVTGRPHQRDALAGLLWGEMPDAAAANNLRQALSNLRKLFEPHLLITRDTVALDPSVPHSLDVTLFTDRLRLSEGQPAGQRIALLRQALALYRGDFLEGFYVRDAPDFEDWALVQRVHLRELALHGWEICTRLLQESGDYASASETARQLLAMDPWREETHRQLMLLDARLGRWSAALAQYEACRRVLEKELGVQPSLQTSALYERIRAARQAKRHNLPAPATALIGREQELANLRRLLANPACRLITLIGLGGAGKTRLALETAHACADMFINGASMAPLAAVDAEGLIPALGGLFDFPFAKGDLKKQLLNFLRQKELLLTLDNFDHLLDSSVLLSEILQAAPDVKLLVTSRERLDLEGEWVVELDGLATPHGPHADDLSAFDATELFLQCARRGRGDASFDAAEQAAIAEICRLVGGLPLAVEIAAAQTRALSCAAIAAEIRQGLDSLASTRRDVPERQRSLRAVFDSSWARLTPAEQRTLAELTVFRGGFSQEAAGQVAEVAPGLHAGASIAPLLDKSLVQRSAERFQLHQVVCQFAGEKLDDPTPVRQAHAAYFAAWAASQMQGEGLVSFALLADELENVRAAWLWGCEHQDVPALAGMADFLRRFLDVQGRFAEGVALFQQALDALDAPRDAAGLALDPRGHLLARLLMARALFAANTGALDQTTLVLESCLAYFRRAQDPVRAVACLGMLGKCQGFLGQPELAAACFGEQLAAARSLNLRLDTAAALNNLATVLTTLNRPQEAEALLRECLTLRRELRDDPGVSSALINLAVALFNQGRYAEEKPLLAEAIEIAGRINQPRNLAGALGNLGTILVREGQHEAALKLFQRGLELHRNTGYRYGTAIALDNVGTAHYHLGNQREAQYYLRQSVQEARAIKTDFVALDALAWLAGLVAAQDEPEAALAWLSMIRCHPQTEPETRQNVESLWSAATAGLSLSAIRQAEALGQRLTLEEVLEQALGL